MLNHDISISIAYHTHTHYVQQDLPSFEARDVVRVIDDIGEVFQLQKGHGEWSDDMALVRISLDTCTLHLHACPFTCSICFEL